MFKEKVSKKRQILNDSSKKDSSTLDEKHKQMILTIQDNLHNKQDLLVLQNSYEKEVQEYKIEIQMLYTQNLQDTDAYIMAWDSNIYYLDQLRFIKRKIKNLSDEKKEIEYYENTGSILFNYYELIHQQETTFPTTNPTTNTMSSYLLSSQKVPAKGRRKMLPTNQKNILDAFKMGEPSSSTEGHSSEIEVKEDIIKDKMTLVNDYLLAIDPTHMKQLNDSLTNQCQRCQVSMNCLIQEGMMICPTCGYQEILLIEQNRPIYRQSNKEASHYTYKRINHFNEWISQIQGKESTDIPEEVFERIVNEIKKEKIKDLSKLTYNKMREILKKLHSNKYYEHIYYIIYRLNGIPAPNFSPEMEDKLRNMFKEIQSPFLKYCPSTRKNFLSYSYVLYKFCQLLDRDEYLKYFTLLKSREKLHLQDQIWRKICQEVNWEFIQSI
uniref:Late transcription factor VLTF3-like protein n=1 Tax=viral metagenome TaxID=1070528 RepID=A0A6C0CTU1_9ZZZZ